MKAGKKTNYQKMNSCCSTKFFGTGYKNLYMNKYIKTSNKKMKYKLNSVKVGSKTAVATVTVNYKSAYDAFYNECSDLLRGNFILSSHNVTTSFQKYVNDHPGVNRKASYKLYLVKKKKGWKIDTTDSQNVRAIGDFLYCDLSRAVTNAYKEFASLESYNLITE